MNERREKVSDEWSKADSEEISPASYQGISSSKTATFLTGVALAG